MEIVEAPQNEINLYIGGKKKKGKKGMNEKVTAAGWDQFL